MAKNLFLLGMLFLAAVLASGCVMPGQQAPEQPSAQVPAEEEQPGVPSGEIPEENATVEVAAVEILDAPETIQSGQEYAIRWRVSLEGTTPHTSVHYDAESHQGDFGTDVAPADSRYTDLVKDFASGNFTIPANFAGKVTAPSGAGTLYLRGHVIFDGKHYWTDEFSIEVFDAQAAGNTSTNGSGYSY